ncbi:hypothetical protein [Deinococcus soli (ex Cha et al. 2016)]|uniref:Uncharacterized protein n=2 Tax=Deinococcus soli (ex Cha et al. 2016) TaxID=1309411 RepID=A0AAE4BPT1_9DEIO|nr:hypothetical protein [Deinococcus soli (ex Cha et al. 2016)]MDR6221390.1 hypothetical protein [Deinococcus soli (ex Cha et al. 2016)]MDR6331397.1 hypothetical protein [Deinococcus soli (ex Cha et al. 2016)]MDR6754555.1 hypothetical protein [Deinococcus soli (ex Cha et al. 2016)]
MHFTESPLKPNDFVVIGYMIIEGRTYTSQPRPELRGVIYSPTSCVSELHPHYGVLSWISTAPQANEEYRQQLDMNLDDFIELQDATEAALDASEWSLDAVFVFRSSATRFFERFFVRRANTRLMELSIRGMDLPDFREATRPLMDPSGMPHGTRAMHLAALRQLPAAMDTQMVGFEVVSVDPHSETHTSVCYAVRDGFEQAGITFNGKGYLANLEDAVKGAQMNNSAPGGSVADAQWFAVRIAELARSNVS